MSTTAINISPGMTRWPAQVRRVRSAFTLTEVLISVALVLVIILGVNQVFSMTGRAVGAGQALSDITRTMRNVQSVMTEDLGNAEIDRAPFFYIDSGVSLGFRNKEDQARDIDFNINGTRAATEDAIRTIDRNGNGRESVSDASDFTPVSFMTVRTHRTDQMGFFTRSTGRRQTGNGNSFTSALSSSEQYVIYGYLLQPADTTTAITGAGRGLGPGSSGTVLKPINTTGADANPNNYYATSWILGRMKFLLREPQLDAANRKVILDAYTNQPIFYFGRGTTATPATSMAPFSLNSRSTNGTTTNADNIQWSYYDVIGSSFATYSQELETYINAVPARDNPVNAQYWVNNVDFRFTGSPLPTRPLTRQGVARTVPCFVPHCTQFAVDYAGDFAPQDGVIDFKTDTVTGTRSIRWYGFPRDENGDGKIIAADDVVPLRDIVGNPSKFEGDMTSLPVPVPPTGSTAPDYGQPNAVALNARYRVAWGPKEKEANLPRPKLIRITMAIDDPAGRIGGEQFIQFVVELP